MIPRCFSLLEVIVAEIVLLVLIMAAAVIATRIDNALEERKRRHG